MGKPFFFLACTLLGSDAYSAAPNPDRPDAATIARACAGCHDLNSRHKGPTPAITGKPEGEFVKIMQDYQSGQRQSSIMNRIAKGYTTQDFIDLADFLGEQ